MSASSAEAASDTADEREQQLDRPPSGWWRTLAVLLAGLLITGVAVAVTLADASAQREERFESAARETEAAAVARVDTYGGLLWSLRGLFNTTEFVARGEFAEFVEALDVEGRFPGTQAVGFAPLVRARDVRAFEQDVRGDDSVRPGGYPDFEVRTGGASDPVMPVTYLEPLDGNEGAFGFDLAGDDAGRKAVETAIATGLPTAGAPLAVVSEEGEQRLLLLLLAVYEGGRVPETLEAREDRFRGVLLGLFAVGQMLEPLLGSDPEVTLEVHDAGAADAAGTVAASEQTLLFSPTGRPDLAEQQGGGDPDEVLEEVGSRRWLLLSTPGPGFDDGDGLLPWVIGGIGAVLTALIAALVYVYGRSRRRAREIAEEMTADLRRRERQLAQATADIVRSNRDLERYATIAAHDLQEPLRSILAYSDLLNRKYGEELSDEVVDYVSRMSQAAQRMRTLVTDLLAYARLETSENRTGQVDLNEVVQAAIGDLTYLIDETSATIEVPELPTVVGNGRELIGVFANLLSNALKYRSPDRVPHVRVSAERRGEEWLIGVADNGIGVAADYHLRIFELFRRLGPRDDSSGTGLGLAICARTIAQHGGRIWVESEEGQGATFWFTLPVHPPAGAGEGGSGGTERP